MDKQELLRQRAAEFRKLLKEAAVSDPRFDTVVERLEPMFSDIESGAIVAPVERTYESYRGIFHPESLSLPYEPSSALFQSESAFMSALEDWPSQRSYKEMVDQREFRGRNPSQISQRKSSDRQILDLAPLPGTSADSAVRRLKKLVNKLRAWLGQ